MCKPSMKSISYSAKCSSALKGVTFTHLSLAAWVNPPAASGTGNNAAPAFVQLRVMGADVVPYIPQSKERLAAELRSKVGKTKG